MNENRVPKIRFKGYTDAWEQCKFKDLFKLSQGLQIPISERYTEKGKNRYFYITNEFLKENSNKKFYIEAPPKSVLCTEKDILMTRTGNTGVVITGVSGCFHNNFFKIDYGIENDKNFICYDLKRGKIQRVIKNYAGNSTIPDLSHTNFYKINSNFPSYKEQIRIGNFFQELDKTITLQKREYK